jgi:capsular polysaccharide biosynthesis protein
MLAFILNLIISILLAVLGTIGLLFMRILDDVGRVE